MGVRGTALGAVSATRPLAGIFAPVLFGWLADSLGLRGSILKWACFGAFLPFAALALLGMHQPQIAGVWLFLAVATSSFFRVPMGTIADVAALEHQKSYGSLRIWGSIGFVVAATVAGKVLDPTLAVPFPAMVAAAYLLALVLSFQIPAKVAVPRKPRRKEVLALLRCPTFAPLLLTALLWAGAHVAYDLTISLQLKALGASPMTTSIAWNIGVAAEILLMASWTRLKGSRSAAHWLKLGLVVTTLRFTALATTKTLIGLVMLQPLHAFSFAVVWLSFMELIRERAPEGLLGSAQGLFSTAIAVGSTIGMLVFGALYESAGGGWTFGVAASIALISVFSLNLRFGRVTATKTTA